jgi:hypothetical protein
MSTETIPQERKDMRTAGPALLATIPGRTKIPAPIMVPTPIDSAAQKPRVRASCVLELELAFEAEPFSAFMIVARFFGAIFIVYSCPSFCQDIKKGARHLFCFIAWQIGA